MADTTPKTVWIVTSPQGHMFWRSAGATYDDSMQACFGNRKRSSLDPRFGDRDHWQDCLDSGWTCREYQLVPVTNDKAEG